MQTLARHLATVSHTDSSQTLERSDCSAKSSRSLPRFDSVVLEHFLDDQRGLKLEVYELFRQHPELLPAVYEGMSKGTSVAVAMFEADLRPTRNLKHLPYMQRIIGSWSENSSLCSWQQDTAQ